MIVPDLLFRLRQGLKALGEDPDAHPCERYLAYIELLVKWNRAYNLTGIRDPGRMLNYHVLDSLAVRPWVRGPRCLDIGTGAGLPGLILALARPDQHWVLLDSNSKKIRFLNECLRELQVNNAETAHTRIEDFHPQQLFTTAVCRALWSAPDLLRECGRLIEAGGVLLAMKGARQEKEWNKELRDAAELYVHGLHVPGVTSERNLVVISPRANASRALE